MSHYQPSMFAILERDEALRCLDRMTLMWDTGLDNVGACMPQSVLEAYCRTCQGCGGV